MRGKIVALVIAALALVPGVAAAAGQAPVPMAPQTTIHAGDQIAVSVFGDQSTSQNIMVLPDGTIDYPLAGRVRVSGLTPGQAASALAGRLAVYVKHPVITVSIIQLGQPNVLVLGDVKTPGKYQLRSDAKLTDAIAAAGGVADTNGAFPPARIAQPNGSVTMVSLQDLLQGGQTSLDAALTDGSVVYIPGPIHFIVDISGAVDHPGDLQVNEGDRLSVAIARAGNSQNAQGDLNHIRLIRKNSDGSEVNTEINLYGALNGGDRSGDVVLAKGDVIYVPQARKHSDLFSGIGGSLLFLLTHIP